MFPSLVSTPDVEIPHERDQINLTSLAYQGHPNKYGFMYVFLNNPPPPLPKSRQWNGAVGLLLCIAAGGWCVIMDLSGVVLSPPKDTNTADIRIVHIFITLAERTHAPTPCCSSISIDL